MYLKGIDLSSKRRIFLILGLFSREALSPWTGHLWDFEVWIRNAYSVAQGMNPYTLLPPAPRLSFAFLGQSMPSVGYLPLWSLILAGIFKLYQILPGGNRFLFYFLLKQPQILGDLLLAYLVAKIILRAGGSLQASRLASNLWLILPYPIIISAIWGQFDSLVSLIWLSSLFAALWIRRSTLLGLGILLKSFPLVTVPYHVLVRKSIPWIGTVLALAVPATFTIFIFGLKGWDYSGLGDVAFTAHGTLGGMTYANFLFTPPLSGLFTQTGLFSIAVAAFWIGAVLAANFLAAKRFGTGGFENLVQAMILITAIFFLTRWSINEQYLIYLLPLLLIDVSIWHAERKMLFHTTWILGLVFLTVNNDLFLRFLGPLYPTTVNLDTIIAYSSSFTGLRYALLDFLGVFFSINILQLALVTLNPKRDSRPWILRLKIW
jgi:hypothetical protein